MRCVRSPHSLKLVLACLVLQSATNGAYAAQGSYTAEPAGWEKVETVGASNPAGPVDERTDVYRRQVPGSPVVAFRGQGYIDAPLTRVASVILDEKRATEWVDSLEEEWVIRMYGEREFLQYSHIGTPFVIKDRDFVTRGKVTADAREGSFTLELRSVEDPAMPPRDHVRGDLQGYWKLYSADGGKRSYLVAEMHADPKGDVPKWLVNLFQKQWPINTFKSLRKQVAKGDVRILPQVAAFFDAEKAISVSAAKTVSAPIAPSAGTKPIRQ